MKQIDGITVKQKLYIVIAFATLMHLTEWTDVFLFSKEWQYIPPRSSYLLL